MHDASKAKTDERVGWAQTLNLATQDPNHAWHEMYDTYAAQGALKAAAGKDARGRKNNKPVLHYTLSWHEDDQPTAEEMKEAAQASLKVMGLGEHEALMAAHKDKQHLHVHIVVNTVHPETGMTAPMKFSKLELSKWAESYEVLNGLHCEARVKNNAERERQKGERQHEAFEMLTAFNKAEKLPEKAPYVPVKHKETSRAHWFDKKEITDRMRAMRAGLDAELKTERDATWQRHQKQRDDLDARSKAGVDQARDHIKSIYKPQWRNLYFNQKKEARYVARLAGDLFERASYVYQYRERLAGTGKPLTVGQMLSYIRAPARLQQRIGDLHEQERRALARQSKAESKALTDAVWQRHKGGMALMRDVQLGERQSEKAAQAQRRPSISFDLAKAALTAEHENAPRPFHRAPEQAPERTPVPQPKTSELPPVQVEFDKAADQTPPPAPLSRADEIKRDMAEWRKRNEGKDQGREM